MLINKPVDCDQFIPKECSSLIFPMYGKRMLELGNKRQKIPAKNKVIVWKDYFRSLGIDHVSIDWNGKDGALALDLRERIELEPFDMVTNFGTSEHVSNQEPVWENMHRLLKVDGIFVSWTPKPGNYWWHAKYFPTKEFYEMFAKLNGYDIEILTEAIPNPRTVFCTRMIKRFDKEFKMPDKELMHINHVRPKT